MESPGTVAILFLHYFGCLWKEPSLNRDGFLKKRRLCFFLELVEATDDFEASGKVLIHGLHLKIEGYAKETVAMRGHVAGLHAT